MSDNFGLKIGIDGEKEFKKALADINQSFKVLGSEMKMVSSQFDDNDRSVQALSSRNAVLNKEIDAQKQKIETLRAALGNASESFGETDRRTQNWQIQLNKAQAELNKMEREVANNEKAMSSMSDEMGDTSDEEEFKKSLASIDSEFKVLGSELKLVDSQFGKNEKSIESLSARNAVLNKEMEAQKSKIDTLRSALEHSASAYGENDERTRDWQVQLNKAQAELNGMQREVKENEESIDKMGREMEDAAKSADDMGDELVDAGEAAEKAGGKFEKFGSVLKGIGAAMGAVVVAAGAAAVELGKEVISAYADYEQLVGGVDTLFKESSGKLQDYAANAYKTAGMDANEYMETVTGFSASLIQSLGGDTEKAVKYADMAITDMSDNANKMGSDMASIQNAYQGFAKQNYTMLDNLKLGYGGTKEEMERLLADAKAISGIEYDISSYADVVDAIHVIQTSMDITGTTAKEASDTISGSISSMQSALQNLVVGFGRADADIEALCDNVVDAFNDVLKNITPVIENIVKALPAVSDALLTAVADLLPTLLDTVTDLFSQILTTILQLLPNLIPATVEAVLTIVTAIVDNLPLLIDAAVQLVMALVSGIGEALPELIPAAVNAVVTIVQGLVENLPMILDAALQLVLGLAQGILNAIPVLIEALPEIITAMLDFFSGATPQIVEAGIQLLTSLITALPEIIGAIVEAMPQIIDGLLNALLAGIPQVIDAGVKLLIALVEDLPYIIDTVVKAVPEIVSSIVNAFWERRGEIVEIGKNLVKGLWDGIQQLAGWLWNKVSDWISSIWDGICDFFGIHSPSREMAWIGEMLVKGLSGSIDDNGSEAVSAAQGMADDINSVFNDLAADMTLPTNFDFDANANLSASMAGGVQAMGSGPLFTVQQMIVRSDDDIRRVSQDLYDMIQTGSRAQGRFVIA